MTCVPNHLVGKRVGNNRLELVSLLGEGSYGAVYRALLHRGGVKEPKYCAVKVLRTTLGERNLMCQRRELELHQQVSDGEGIVTLYESFKEGNYQYMVMKLCPDGDLWHGINRKQYLGNDTRIKDVFTQVLDAIDYCHSHNVFHRDIKPENILLCEGGRKALLSDFGLATGNCISTEIRTGSPWYMSPECWGASSQDRSYATAPNDVWSLGILLLNLACRQKAPWNFANLNDRIFSNFVKHPYLLRLVVPLHPEVHDILARVFLINPAERIKIKDLKAAIQNVKYFGIPTACLTEYYNYQHATWRAAIVPDPPRPLALNPTYDMSQVMSRPSFSPRMDEMHPQGFKKIRMIAPSTLASPNTQVNHKTTLSVVPVNSSTLPLSPSSSCVSSIDSDGPVTPQMHAVSVSGVQQINIDVPLLDQTHSLAQPPTVFAPALTTKTTHNRRSTLDDSWQTILDAMDAW